MKKLVPYLLTFSLLAAWQPKGEIREEMTAISIQEVLLSDGFTWKYINTRVCVAEGSSDFQLHAGVINYRSFDRLSTEQRMLSSKMDDSSLFKVVSRYTEKQYS